MTNRAWLGETGTITRSVDPNIDSQNCARHYDYWVRPDAGGEAELEYPFGVQELEPIR